MEKSYIVKIKVEGMDINQAITCQDDLILLMKIFNKIESDAKKIIDENKLPPQPLTQ